MAITRSNAKRRKVRARRTLPRRSFNITRYRRGMKPLTVTRTAYLSTWVPGTASTSDFWRYLADNLSSFPDIASYRLIFDEAKVLRIKYTFRPRYTGFDGANTTDTTLPGVTNQGSNHVHVIIDPKSLIVPSGTYTTATLNNFLQNGNVRTYSGHRPFSITIKYPCVREDLNGATNAKVQKSMWHDIDRNIPHYGAHVFIQDVNMTGTFGQAYDVFMTMTVSFKGSR